MMEKEKSDVDIVKEKANTKCFKLKQFFNDPRLYWILILVLIGGVVALSVITSTREKVRQSESKAVMYQPVDLHVDDEDVDQPLKRYSVKASLHLCAL